MKRIATIISIFIGISVLTGVGFSIDKHYAKAKQVEQLAIRLDVKILKDRANAIQERMWKLEDRYGSIEKMPTSVKEEYRTLKAELETILSKLGKK